MANAKPKNMDEVKAVIAAIRERNFDNMKSFISAMSDEEKAIFHEGRECGLVQAGVYIGLMTAAGTFPTG